MSNKNIYFHCVFCKYDCKTKRVFTNHIMTQDHMLNIKNNTANIITENPIKNNNHQYICQYCDVTYKYKKTYAKHMLKCKKQGSINLIKDNFDIPTNVMDSFIKSWKHNPEKINKLAKHNFNFDIGEYIPHANNISQSNQPIIIDNRTQTINNIIQNNIIQNNTINIMPFGKEDLSTLTEEVRKAIYCRGFSSFEELINEIYKNGTNINIYISNKREGTVKFINDKMEIEVGDLHDAVEKIVESKKDILEDILDEFRGTQNIHAETRIKKLDKAHSNCSRDSEYTKLSRKKLIQITPIGKQNLKKIESMK